MLAVAAVAAPVGDLMDGVEQHDSDGGVVDEVDVHVEDGDAEDVDADEDAGEDGYEDVDVGEDAYVYVSVGAYDVGDDC